VTLFAIEFCGEVTDMCDFDFLGIETSPPSAASHYFLHHDDDIFTFLHPVASKVGLITTKNIHRCSHNTSSSRTGRIMARAALEIFRRSELVLSYRFT